MKRYFWHIGWTALAAVVLGLIVMLSGLVPIKASSGHWPITRWFLDFAKSRSVGTHSIGIDVPELDAEWKIVKGAGMYEMNCSWCHGTPSLKSPRVMGAATPEPPYLPDRILRYGPAELFYITKHGIKFTGMPAWPVSNRDDEVWAMTAFLQQLPEMDLETYQQLALGPPAELDPSAMEQPGPPESPPQAVTVTCARCHGEDGQGRGVAAFPRLAGQPKNYLVNTLKAYRAGQRHSGAMEPIAAKLKDEEIETIADYYAKRDLKPKHTIGSGEEHAAAVERGRRIAEMGIPTERIPSCFDCHYPYSEGAGNPNYPVLTGQYYEYLELQLKLFHKKQRGGTEYHHLMDSVAPEMSPQQMRDVAIFYEAVGRNGD